MERYNIKDVEKKWQGIWSTKKNDAAVLDRKKKKILLFRNVSIPIRKNSHGPCKKLYYWGRSSSI